MILYYSLGGGLGHIARSLALLEYAPKTILTDIRLLVSSKGAEVARPHSPCPMDLVPEWAMAERGLYSRFLTDYLREHNFSCMVIDSFPFGLLGELKHIAPDLPRVLVGRYLRWDAYKERCGSLDGAVWPRVALIIERQEDRYLEKIGYNSRVIMAQWPISLATPTNGATPGEKQACCVVHSGPPAEMSRLMNTAHKITTELGLESMPEVFTPEKGLFPLERHLAGFSDVVTGAGYAGCAAATILKNRIRYHLHPFPRKFDDQELRLKRLQEGQWGNGSIGDASTVAEILWREIIPFLPQVP